MANNKLQKQKTNPEFLKMKKEFLSIRPIFGGDEYWDHYKGMLDTYNKLSLKVLSQADLTHHLSVFHNQLDDFFNNKKMLLAD